MKRRRLVTLGGVSVLAGLSGCSSVYGRFSDAPRTPEGMEITPETWPHGLVDHEQFEGSDDTENPFATVVTSHTAATEALWTVETGGVSGDPIEFIDATDFDASYLLVVEWCCRNSSSSLEVARIQRRDGGLHVEADVVVPDGFTTDDMSRHTLFVRVTDEEADAPESVTVDVRE